MGEAEGQEAGHDLRPAVALEGPAQPLGALGAGVEHGRDEHDAVRDAALGGAEEEAEGNCDRARFRDCPG